MSFRYRTGEEVRVGDKVRTGNQKSGIVKVVIRPGSRDCTDFNCPQGGILIEEDWDGVASLLLLTPDVAYWEEELDFLEHG